MCNWSSKLLEEMWMLLVFSPNWFPIFIGFVLSSWPQNTGSPFFFLFKLLFRRIYGHLQSGRGFCKQNLLWLQPSVNSTHEQPCLSEQHIHTHTHARTFAHMGVDWIKYGQQGEERDAIIHPACPSQIPSRPSLVLDAQWLSNSSTFPFPRSRSIVCLCLSSRHLTQQLTTPLKLTVWSKETKKLKRAFPWWLGCNNTTAKLNHFSFLPSVCLPAACYVLPLLRPLFSPPLSPIPIQVLNVLAQTCPVWFDQDSVLEVLARLAIMLALVLASHRVYMLTLSRVC